MDDNEKEEVSILEKWKEPVSFEIEIIKDGNCRAEHKKGQSFRFDWNTPEGICAEAFVGFYSLLHSFRVMGDMRELGSTKRNERVYNCPSRVIQFKITAKYRCNLCAQELEVIDGAIQSKRLENRDQNLWVRVCNDCFNKYKNSILVW